jgi:cation-transporting ATPase I
LQHQGRVVALVSGRAGAALRTADCGIGVLSDAAPPWQADLLCGPGLAQAIRIVDAIAAARAVSRRGALIALYGSVAAALLALAGPRAGTGGRASLAINSAAAVGVASGAWSGRALAERPDALATDDTPWHALDADVALDRLHSSAAGLDARQAHERQARRPETSKQGDVGLLPATLQELANPLTSTLGTAAAMSGATGSLADALLIVSVLGANGLLGGIQRVATERALRGLVQDGAARVRVRRDHEDHDIDAESVVAGDVIIVRAGDAVPADCRILEAAGLEVDESRLTGESRLVTKTAQPSAAASMAERHSMLYEGSLVAAGYAVAVVVAAGPDSELGRTAVAATGVPPRSGVQERLRRLTTASLPIALGAGAALVGGGLLRGARIGDRIGSGVSLAVAAVPEGLPVVATVGQIAAARRLSGRRALVRNHSVMEALGRVDVLCFDKTGTLTEGGMRLRRVCEGLLDCPVEALPGAGRHVLATGLRAGPAPDADRMMPHPTDRAVALAASTIGITAEHGLGGWQMLDELPFESSRGYHAALGATPDGRLLCVKGAPETVLPGCVCWRRGEQVRPLGGEEAAAIQAQVARLAGEGYRVLAVAQRTAGRRTRLDARLVTRLEFLGLLALADPVRPQAAAAVAGLREARVKVMMMTGDHPSTAESVAQELDILDGGTLLTGADLDRLDDAQLAEVLPRVSVFARVTPAHKVRVVQALQAAGHTVAMAGDGANDATAIRLADVGVAFGKSSTDAARQAADLVVTDGRVETLIDAVVEGRAMWASVRDAVSVLLGGNLGEIAFTLGAGLVSSAGSPLNARQLLVVNLLTDLLPSMALAVRPPSARNPGSLLREGPDASMGGALARDTFVRAAATAGSTAGAWLTARATGTPTRAGTVALVTLVATQLGQTVAAGWRSPLVLAASATSAATLAGIVQTPGVSQFFGCRPLGPVGWATALGASGLGTGAAQIASALTRRAA